MRATVHAAFHSGAASAVAGFEQRAVWVVHAGVEEVEPAGGSGAQPVGYGLGGGYGLYEGGHEGGLGGRGWRRGG